MRRNTTYKSGHLDIKLPVKMRARGFRGWKAWKRRWIVLHRLQDIAAGNAIVTLDLYHNSSGERQNHLERATIYLEGALHLQKIVSRSHPYAFYVEARDTAVYLAAECETDTQEWMDAICQVFWPRPQLNDDTDDVFETAVTDSAFCNLFGVHGGFCYICLTSKDNLLLQCVYTQHVLLEWPLAALARVYLDNPIHLKDRGRLFVIEPRPHTSGWTTPLHFFSIKAHVIVEHINTRLQGRAGASKISPHISRGTEKHTLSRRCTSFYDQPLPSSKYKQERRISEMSHYDTPRAEIDSVDMSNIVYPAQRKRSHSESYLHHAANCSTESLNENPNNMSALSYNQLDAQNTDEEDQLADSEFATFLSSKDSGFQMDDYAKVKSAPIEKDEVEVIEEEQKPNKSTRSEPLYEELDRLHKDINKLLGIDIEDNMRPPPLPPRCPSVVYPLYPEAQKKDVVRFLGMEDPLAKRIVHSQQTTIHQMTQGVRKKNLFYFLGVDGIHSTSPGFNFDSFKRPEVNNVNQNKTTYENNIFFDGFRSKFPQVESTCGQFPQVDYDVPIPIGLIYDSYELFAEKLMQKIWKEIGYFNRRVGNFKNEYSNLGLSPEKNVYSNLDMTTVNNMYSNLDIIAVREVKVYKNTKSCKKRFEILRKFGCVQLVSTTVFFSVLYYSWLLNFYKQVRKEKEYSTDKLRKYILIARLYGWCHDFETKQLTC